MGEVTDLFEYRGTCLECGTTWEVTPAQLEVARVSEILYSPCCEKPSTIVRVKAKRK